MTERRRSYLVPVALAALWIGVGAAPTWAATPFGEANIFLELNHTDGDLGIHALIDGDPWKELELESPSLEGDTVFNAEQIEGLPPHFYTMAEPRLDPVQRIDHAERFFAATGADIRHGGNQAYYSVTEDRVQMPPFEGFRDAESYYATLAHEVTHWTRHASRLEREFGRKRWGDEGYAIEELVAELGSAFLSADLDLALEPRPDHAAYIESWLKVLKQDKRAIFSAASHAQRAADFLNGLQPSQMEAAA